MNLNIKRRKLLENVNQINFYLKKLICFLLHNLRGVKNAMEI